MEAIEKFVRRIGRYLVGGLAVGLGIGLALVCTFVIVTTDVGQGRHPKAPGEVVRLDPVVVTISADRFAEIASELHGRPAMARTANHGASEG